MLIAYPRLSPIDLGVVRILGPGLGNLLFAWARAIVAAHRNAWPVLFPTWPQVKIGPLLRRETDTRAYFGFFRSTGDYVTGIERMRMMMFWPRLDENEAKGRDPDRNGLVLFEGMEGHFSEVLNDHRFVRRRLLEIVRGEHKVGLAKHEASIVVHVRLGDFVAASPEALRSGHYNARIPLEWYGTQVRSLQRLLPDTPVDVFSDGRDEDLRSLLALPGVKRVRYGSGLAELLAVSCGRVLVASGSTFSMWASYLGRMPVIWHQGQLRQRLYGDNVVAEVEVGESKELPASFSTLIR
jgi:hypothetical protein